MKYTLRDALTLCFRYSRVLIIFWAVVVVAALVFYSQTQRIYESTATILVSLGTEELGRADYLSTKNLMLVQREQEIHNEQQILESQEVLMLVAKRILGEPTPHWNPPVTEDRLQEVRRYFTNQDSTGSLLVRAVKTLGRLSTSAERREKQLEDVRRQIANGLSVKAVYDSDTLDIVFRYRNAAVAQTVLSLVIDAYLQHHIAVFRNSGESDLLKTQLDHSISKYHNELAKFSSFMTAHQLYNDDTQATVLVEQRMKLKQALDEAMGESNAASARLAMLNRIQDSLRQLEHYSTTEVRNKERDALMGKLSDAEIEEQTILARHPKGSRAYEDEESKLNQIRELIQQQPERLVQETERRKSKASELVDSEMVTEAEMQRGSDAKIQELGNALARLDGELNRYASDLKAFNALKLDVSLAKQESEQMAQVYAGSQLKSLTAQNAITDVSIIDKPTLALIPVSPNVKITLAAVLLLLAIGTFVALFGSAALDTTMADSATVEQRLGAPVIVTLPAPQRRQVTSRLSGSLTDQSQHEFALIYQSMVQQPALSEFINDEHPVGKIVLVAETANTDNGNQVGYSLARFIGTVAGQKAAFITRTTTSAKALSSGSASLTGDHHTFLEWTDGQEERPLREVRAANAALDLPGPAHSVNGNSLISTLNALRKDFAYIVLVVGSVKESSDLLVLSGIASAVYFVVEASRTRSAAARHSLDLLYRYGYRNVQTILNNRIFYIPKWLMRFV